MPRPLRIALCQFCSIPPAPGEDTIERNIDRARAFVEQAANQQCDLIVFPEFFLSGIMADDLHLAQTAGHYEDRLKAAARDHDIDIVAGSIVERHGERGDLFNTAYYVSSKGELLHTYRKRNLWHPCARSFQLMTTLNNSQREEPQVFDTGRCRAGICICWDLAWPETFRALMREGAEVIIVPTYWTVDDLGELGRKHDPNGDHERAFIDSLVVARAYESNAAVIFVNTGGPASRGFIGRSTVAMPLRGAISRMEDPEEEFRVIEVDLDVLKDAEEVYKIRADYAETRR